MSESASALEEIMVTARKQTESLLEIPVSVSAFDAQALEVRGIENLYDVAEFAPGFNDQRQGVGRADRGFTQFIVRGVVPGSALPSRQATTIFVDGAPITGGDCYWHYRC